MQLKNSINSVWMSRKSALAWIRAEQITQSFAFPRERLRDENQTTNKISKNQQLNRAKNRLNFHRFPLIRRLIVEIWTIDKLVHPRAHQTIAEKVQNVMIDFRGEAALSVQVNAEIEAVEGLFRVTIEFVWTQHSVIVGDMIHRAEHDTVKVAIKCARYRSSQISTIHPCCSIVCVCCRKGGRAKRKLVLEMSLSLSKLLRARKFPHLLATTGIFSTNSKLESSTKNLISFWIISAIFFTSFSLDSDWRKLKSAPVYELLMTSV